VSIAGGSFPRWRRDGEELFYLSTDGLLMAASVDGKKAAFEVGAVRPLFEVQQKTAPYLGYGTGYNLRRVARWTKLYRQHGNGRSRADAYYDRHQLDGRSRKVNGNARPFRPAA
jgi:hypothetical protein